MKRLTQICASYNHLFGLDEDGHVHQYNFNTKAWVQLTDGEGGEGPEPIEATARESSRDAWSGRR